MYTCNNNSLPSITAIKRQDSQADWCNTWLKYFQGVYFDHNDAVVLT